MLQRSEPSNPILRLASRITVVSLAALQLSACLPRDAPTRRTCARARRHRSDTTAERIPYALISLSPSTVDVANRQTAISRVGNFSGLVGRGGGRSADFRISVGDVLGVTIFEAERAACSSRRSRLARRQFRPDPEPAGRRKRLHQRAYAGNVKVAGQTAAQLERRSPSGCRAARSSRRRW